MVVQMVVGIKVEGETVVGNGGGAIMFISLTCLSWRVCLQTLVSQVLGRVGRFERVRVRVGLNAVLRYGYID